MGWGAIIGAVVQAVPAVIQAVKGGEQKAQGEAGLANLKRPEYYDSIARMAYGDKTMPGEVNMLDRNDLIAQNAYRQAIDSGNPLAKVSAIQAMNQKGAIDIGIQSAQHRERDMVRLQNALNTEYQMNEFAPYAEKAQEYRDMIGAGEKNQFSGISNMSGIASSVMSNMDFGSNDNSKYNSGMAEDATNSYKNKWGKKQNMKGDTYMDSYDARYKFG